jgi:hypothetical protein
MNVHSDPIQIWNRSWVGEGVRGRGTDVGLVHGDGDGVELFEISSRMGSKCEGEGSERIETRRSRTRVMWIVESRASCRLENPSRKREQPRMTGVLLERDTLGSGNCLEGLREGP